MALLACDIRENHHHKASIGFVLEVGDTTQIQDELADAEESLSIGILTV